MLTIKKVDNKKREANSDSRTNTGCVCLVEGSCPPPFKGEKAKTHSCDPRNADMY